MLLKPAAAAMAAAGLWLWEAAPWDDGNDHWKLLSAQASLTHGSVIATERAGERNVESVL
ncbi:hypothetical protein [Actinocorallia libanotica]|uniref:Uncharacterized protein n=1 Tax=Actinocorallia libanotica TaxID=46162 RepID=A0ABN1RJI3_9ACTN